MFIGERQQVNVPQNIRSIFDNDQAPIKHKLDHLDIARQKSYSVFNPF